MKKRKIKIMLIEDEAYDVRRVRQTIKLLDDQLILEDVVSNGHDAIRLLESKSNFDVAIMDYQIAGGISGEALIRKMKEIDPIIQIIVITKMTTNITDFEFANRLLEAGAMWYCTKYPGDIEDYIYQPTDFILSIFNAYEKRRLEKARRSSDKRLTDSVAETLERKKIIGESLPIQILREQIAQSATADTTVLIRGASGTGKELVAANIHYNHPRRLEKFVAINCGSLPGDLIESELFGFEKGAFTGALNKKAGLFEIANGGTIFLDEIAELPLSSQVKLLRVIQEGEIDKIGRTGPVKVDVRIIAATNKNLEEEVRQKRFREDLYYRLNVVSIIVPPLKDRLEDIPRLIEHFSNQYSAEMNRPTLSISNEAMQVLVSHSWPGNVRQLQNVVQRLLFTGATAINATVASNALKMPLDEEASETAMWDPNDIRPLREVEREFREQYFDFVRSHTTSDAEAARKLGLAPPNYHRMCKELGLK
ncbi:MAG: sigma 54-interacting transcriptional regulator [Calditrichia bacterium]